MDGVRVDLRSGEEGTCTEQNGQKKLVRVRERVRITFSFISTGTDSVPVPYSVPKYGYGGSKVYG